MISKARLFVSPTLNMILIYFFSFLAIFLNATIIGSPIAGFVASMIYVYLSSVMCGNVFFKDEVFWHKILLGFSVFILLLSLVASVVLGVYELTSFLILLVLFAITSFLIILNVRMQGFKALFAGMQKAGDVRLGVAERQKRRFAFSVERVLQVLYVILFVVSFLLLLVSRSGEVTTVWSVMHPAFFPVFFGSTVVLLLVLFSKAGKGTKLLFVLGHSLLVHSLLVVVMNPGLLGDQFYELGYAREVYVKGWNVPSLLDYLFGAEPFYLYRTIYFVARKRVYQALVVVFANMFKVDVYWSHILLTPVLWSIIVPFITYKITKRLGGNETSSIFAAFLSLSVPALIWWGALTVPDTLGKVFFFLAAYFTVEYVSSRERKFSLVFLAFVAMLVAFLTEFINGVLFFAVLLLALAFREYRATKNIKTKVLFMITTGISFFIFPASLFALGEVRATPGYVTTIVPVRFVPENLLETDPLALIFGGYVNYTFRYLLPLALIPLLGFMGLLYVVMFTSNKRYNRSVVLFLLLAEIVFLVDYRFLKYCMTGYPFSAERMWVFRDLLIVPFGAIIVVRAINEIQSRIRATSFRFPRIRLSAFSVMTLFFCMVISGFAMIATENAYAKSAPAALQPTPYEVEAIEYIHKNTPEKYVVICDSTFRNLALGLLGWRYFADFSNKVFNEMAKRPSISAMLSLMDERGAPVGYFVVSTRSHKDINSVVESTQKVFGVYAVFGDGKLYVFRYPSQEISYDIPLEINPGNHSRVNYVLEYELNATDVLSKVSGHLDPNSICVIASDGSETPTQFDYYQGWFDDCSTSDNWSGEWGGGKVTSYVGSNGDILACTASFTTKGPEAARLMLSRFERNDGNLTIDTTKYKYVEVKWAENLDEIAHVRVAFFEKGYAAPVKYVTMFPSTEWSVWHYDISTLGILSGLWFDIYDSGAMAWTGDYMLYIDWIRFIGDTGTVRFLYNGTANTVDSYRIEYDTLEDTESGNRDFLPKKSYPHGISSMDETKFYNFTWKWDGHVVNFLVNKEATRWIEAPGETFSYSLQIDDVNILTSDTNNRGGMGIMQTSDSMTNISVAYKDAQLICDGPVMTEVLYETNGYGNLYVRFYQGKYPRILFRTENGNSTVGSTYGKYAWLVSTNTTDDKVYYLKDDGTVGVGDLSGNESSGTWQAQSLGQYEANGYLIVLGSLTEIVASYGASYNNFGSDTQDYMFYSSGSMNDTKFMYVIGKNQSIEEIENIIMEVIDVPLVHRWRSPNSLTMRVVDLLNQPLPEVEIEVRELGMKVVTDRDGWAHVEVQEGQWTLIASKYGVTNEKGVDVFTNVVTLQRLNLVKIGTFTLSILESLFVFCLIVIGVVFLLVLVNKKILKRRYV